MSDNIQTITIKELEDKLSNTKGATFVTMSYKSDYKMNKGGRGDTPSNPYYGSIGKETKVNGVINWDYEKSVNRQLEREGKETEFKVQSRTWGEHVEDTPLIENYGKKYLQLKVENVYKSVLFHKDTKEEIEDKVAFLSELNDNWLTSSERKKLQETPEEKEQRLQEERERSSQGTDKEIVVRTYDLKKIDTITMNKETFKVVEE